MAERRMFAKTIVLSDAFLDMPMSARCLYFTLGMFADDDGFVNAPKAIMRQCGASDDDMKLLIAKKFIIVFETGVIVIKHWRINNYLRNDRYQETKYSEEKSKLSIGENGAYHLAGALPEAEEDSGIPNSGIPNDGDTQYRLGKDSIGKDSIHTEGKKPSEKVFVPPTLEEVEAYCRERNSPVDAKQFYDYFTAGNWYDSKGQKVRSWKQKLITWEKGGNNNAGINQSGLSERDRKSQEVARKYAGRNFYSE